MIFATTKTRSVHAVYGVFARGCKSSLALLMWVSLVACAQHPAKRLASLAEENTLEVFELRSGSRRLKVLARPELKNGRPLTVLRVYLEGDGRPWVNGGQNIADNPSSHSLLGLRLMLEDARPSLYLNRPCYGYTHVPAACTPKDWTDGRYSESIIAAMDQAIDSLKTRYQAESIEFIGFSGGGTIATLISARRTDVSTLVTLAANLDHQAWTDYFPTYLPLTGSMNARDHLPLATNIKRWHHLAAKDHKVPITVSADAAAADTGAEVIVHKTFDHTCCWVKAWSKILHDMDMDRTE